MKGMTLYFLKELQKIYYTLLKDMTSTQIDLYAVKLRLEEILMLSNLAMKKMDMNDDGEKHPPKFF